jgi:multicomponent Na+:H+ antiporter subunit B
MIPFIQLYALYVMVGTEGAGGGFQGGVAFAASLILLVAAFGLKKGWQRIPEPWCAGLNSLGLYLYAGVGILAILASFGAAEYLNYGAIPLGLPREEIRALLISDVVEVGIGLTVMSIFVSIFFDLAHKEEEDE